MNILEELRTQRETIISDLGKEIAGERRCAILRMLCEDFCAKDLLYNLMFAVVNDKEKALTYAAMLFAYGADKVGVKELEEIAHGRWLATDDFREFHKKPDWLFQTVSRVDGVDLWIFKKIEGATE